jgi:hypothetical protein
MNSFSTSTRGRLAPRLLLVLGAAGAAACSTQVDVAASAAATGAGGSTSSGPTTTSATSATTSSSVGSGGGGIGPLACPNGDGAIVVGSSNQQAVVAVQTKGTWSEIPSAIPGGAIETAAYINVYHQYGVLWTESVNGVDQAHFLDTNDGTSIETHDVVDWHPQSSAPLFNVGVSALVGSDAEGTSLAYYDSDAMDWTTWTSTPFKPTSAAVSSATGAVVLVGTALGNTLCDVTLDSTITWGPMKCHPELPVFLGNEIPVAAPQIVALAGADMVAVYHKSYLELTAVVLHEGQWSKPFDTTLPEQSLASAVTSTPAGDVLAAIVYTNGALGALRFSPKTGWGSSLPIDTGLPVTQRLAAAPGICGDDALIAYATGEIGGELRVARVRGDASATTTVAKLVADTSYRLSLATQRGAIF